MFLHEHEGQVRQAEHQLEIELELLWERFPNYQYAGREYGRHRRQRVKQVLIQIVNNQKFIIMPPLSLNNGNQAPILSALVDANTLQPIPNATKVLKSASSDTPAVATVDANGNLVSVAIGTGNLTVINTWSYVDDVTNLPVTADETTVTPFQVVVTPEGVLQVVTLGPAVAIPAAAPAPAGTTQG